MTLININIFKNIEFLNMPQINKYKIQKSDIHASFKSL